MSKQEKVNFGAPENSTTEVDKYEFEPIQGHPMLTWRGKRPFTSTQFYPAQLKETHGEDVEGWRNKIYWGDNLQVLSHLLKEYRGKVDLIYIDPPFDPRVNYKKTIKIKSKQVANDFSSFEEKQYTDIWSNDEYLQFMYERICLMKEILSTHGTMYLHCDQSKGHLLRCVMDEVFGEGNFLNEIIWCYSERGISKTYWNKKHDNIFAYTKKKGSHFFDPSKVREDYSEEYLKKFKYTDEEGRKYQIRGKNIKGSPVQRADGLTPEHETKYPGLTYRQYNEGGMLPKDWWEIPLLNKAAHERTGYPTQKPELVIEKIVQASCPPGGLVFDCFMGSGTTQAVAMKLGRRFIGAEINLGAIQTTTKRLLNIANKLHPKQQPLPDDQKDILYTGFEVYNVNHYDVFRNPLEAKELLIEALEIQPLEKSNLYDGEKDGRMVKIMPVNRIATRADLNELINGFDYKAFERRQDEKPNHPVEKFLLVCMGHEADLKATLEKEVPFKLDIKVVDILRDKSKLEFKRDSEARVEIEGDKLVIKQFYPMNLLQKLSLQKEKVDDWRELVESVMVDWNYDGAVLEPAVVDLPGKDELVKGEYTIPKDAGTIMVKITDLLSESLEQEISHG